MMFKTEEMKTMSKEELVEEIKNARNHIYDYVTQKTDEFIVNEYLDEKRAYFRFYLDEYFNAVLKDFTEKE